MHTLLFVLFAIATVPMWTTLSATTALMAQAGVALAFLPLALVWGKGARTQTLPPLLATGLGAMGIVGALGLVAAAAGMAAGRIGPPLARHVALATGLGTVGLCAVFLPNTVLAPTAGAGLSTLLLLAAWRGRAGFLASALASAGVGMAWGLVGQGIAPVTAALIVVAGLAAMQPGWRLTGVGCAGMLAGAACGMLMGGIQTPNPLQVLAVAATLSIWSFFLPSQGRAILVAVAVLAAMAHPLTALWTTPTLLLAGAWGGALRPVLAGYLAPTTGRRGPPPPSPAQTPSGGPFRQAHRPHAQVA
jgi:hypothetical protein